MVKQIIVPIQLLRRCYCFFSSLFGGSSDKEIQIGNQIWKGKNLDTEAPGSVYYDQSSSNLSKYGRMYSWDSAKDNIPEGWRLPTVEDFAELISFVENKYGNNVSDALIKGCQTSFNADFGGAFVRTGADKARKFFGKDKFVYFWTASSFQEDGKTNIYVFGIPNALKHCINNEQSLARESMCYVRLIKK